MPAATSGFGISKVSLVNALLIVDGKNLGSRFFVVPICNEREMYNGITATRLPPRPGTSPLDWALTRFTNVHLPFSALVASDPFDLSLPSNPREAWWATKT
jgi:acyl-CoA oxidase